MESSLTKTFIFPLFHTKY